MGTFASREQLQQRSQSSVCYPFVTCAYAAYYIPIDPQTDRFSHVRKKDLLSTPGAGGLQCHLEMNLLRLKGNLSSPPERGGEGEKVEAAVAGQVR